MNDIYTQNIIFHGSKSPNKRVIDPSTYTGYEVNTLCGDKIKLYIQTDESGKIIDASFEGDGCSISQAAVSLLIEELRNMNVYDAKNLSEDFIYEILGVKVNPAREKCALLSLKTLKAALKTVD